jgi:fructokinase
MQTSLHPVVCYGEVLWDILPTGRLPGGAPMNVAYHLKKLGINPALISKIGLDSYGEGLISALTSAGLSTEHAYIDYMHPTGLVYANLNDHQEVVYDIVYPSAWDFIEITAEIADLVKSATCFVYGSLTSRSKVSRDTLTQLLEVANRKVLDINLRPPHVDRTHIEHLLAKADILKMNIAELELITGWFSNFFTTEERIKLMQDKFKIDTLIVTMGGDGALVNHDGKFYRHPGYKVEVADTIGSGDAFLAGFLQQLLARAPIDDALTFASGIGAFVATKKGACPDYQPAEITALMEPTQPAPFETELQKN